METNVNSIPAERNGRRDAAADGASNDGPNAAQDGQMTSVRWVPADTVRAGKFNLRNSARHDARARALAKQIKSTCVCRPLRVVPRGDNSFECVDGHTRYRAVVNHLGWSTVPVEVVGSTDHGLYQEAVLTNDSTRLDPLALTRALVADLDDRLRENQEWCLLAPTAEERTLAVAREWQAVNRPGERKRGSSEKIGSGIMAEFESAVLLLFRPVSMRTPIAASSCRSCVCPTICEISSTAPACRGDSTTRWLPDRARF